MSYSALGMLLLLIVIMMHDYSHGPLARYVKLWVAHAPGMPGTFSPPPRVSDPDMHHGTCVTHVPWCMPGSLISYFLWNRWRGKRSRHPRRMRNPQFYVSGKRPMRWAQQMFVEYIMPRMCLRWSWLFRLPFSNIWGCMCSTGPFEFRWLKYFDPSYYHHQIESIYFPVAVISLCGCTIIHDIYIPGTPGLCFRY